MEAKLDLRGLLIEELKEKFAFCGIKPFRATQVFQWIQNKVVDDQKMITNLDAQTRDFLGEYFFLKPSKLFKEQISRDGTRKYLWELKDQSFIESVLLHHSGDLTRNRYTLCISTQVGCAMGCGFCATGKMGFTRNLTAGEIVSQVLDTTYLQRKHSPDFKINNLVYMGMGEPLLNLPAVLKSIKILNHKEGQNIGMRRITLSTCGIVPQIYALAEEELDLVLAISLHAPNNELRNQIMPVNQKYPLPELLKACRYYFQKTGRRLTFEYALIENFNDQSLHARQLAHCLEKMAANVNIIPVNTISFDNNVKYQKPSQKVVQQFVKKLKELGVQAVIREEKGSDIEAACGQLAGSSER